MPATPPPGSPLKWPRRRNARTRNLTVTRPYCMPVSHHANCFLRPRLANFFLMPASRLRPSWPRVLASSRSHSAVRPTRPKPSWPDDKGSFRPPGPHVASPSKALCRFALLGLMSFPPPFISPSGHVGGPMKRPSRSSNSKSTFTKHALMIPRAKERKAKQHKAQEGDTT